MLNQLSYFESIIVLNKREHEFFEHGLHSQCADKSFPYYLSFLACPLSSLTVCSILNRYFSHPLRNGLVVSAKDQPVIGCIGHYILDVITGFQQWNTFRVLIAL